MAGHSKWKNNLSRKTSQDKKRSVNFTKLSRLITASAAEGGADPGFNPRLRVAIQNARAASMPNANIDRAIAKSAGPDASAIKPLIYEIFAPGGVNMIVTAASNNPNRTHTQIGNILYKQGGKMGTQGSIIHTFRHCAIVEFAKTALSADEAFALGDALQAFDLQDHPETYSILFPYAQLHSAFKIVEESQKSPIEAPAEFYLAEFKVTADEATLLTIQAIEDALHDLDDINDVFTNLE